ncbi:MAG: hypothetical protein IJB52_08655 [Clostridia bacterium]|nr:hypothetical protein [Clostridia bacterium]
METVMWGTLVLFALVLTGNFLYRKKPFPGGLTSAGAMVLIWLTGRSWLSMLIQSGKDTTLLGFYVYPAVPVIQLILSVLAAGGMIVSAVMFLRRRHTNKE